MSNDVSRGVFAGAVSLRIALFSGAAWWSRRATHTHSERHVTPTGDYYEDTEVR